MDDFIKSAASFGPMGNENDASGNICSKIKLISNASDCENPRDPLVGGIVAPRTL